MGIAPAHWEILRPDLRFLRVIPLAPLTYVTNLYSVTILILLSSVVYNKYADEPVYSVTVIFQIDKKSPVCNLVFNLDLEDENTNQSNFTLIN